MKTSKALVWLSWLIAALAVVAASVGLFYMNSGNSFSFITARGEIAQVYGQGLYWYDSPIVAIGFRVADAVTLVLAIPLLILSSVLYQRGSLKGGLLLTGVLSYFLYNYGSMAVGAAYNALFLIYVALFSSSLFGLVLALTSFDVKALPTHFSKGLQRRGIGTYLMISGVLLILVWLILSIVPALLSGKAPAVVGSYTTFITGVIDIGIIGPALIVAGALLLRRAPIGYLLACMMLIFTVVLGPNITIGGITQVLTGVISPGPFIGGTLPFTILMLIALWFTVTLFRNFSEAKIPREKWPEGSIAHA